MIYSTGVPAYYITKAYIGRTTTRLIKIMGEVIGETGGKYIFKKEGNKKHLRVNKWQVMNKSNYDRESKQKI